MVSWKVERLENAIFRETAFFFNANREPRSKPRRQRALHYLRGIRVRNLFCPRTDRTRAELACFDGIRDARLARLG